MCGAWLSPPAQSLGSCFILLKPAYEEDYLSHLQMSPVVPAKMILNLGDHKHKVHAGICRNHHLAALLSRFRPCRHFFLWVYCHSWNPSWKVSYWRGKCTIPQKPTSKCILEFQKTLAIGLVSLFNGILTFMGYLMPKPSF